MSSNRQWATVTRVPERYPADDRLLSRPDRLPGGQGCHLVLQRGQARDVRGPAGIQAGGGLRILSNDRYPRRLQWEANDQFAEEAFTVYDHPKVLIFQKQPDFSAAQVQKLLGAVDLSNVVHLTPRQAGSYKSLMLSPAALAQQQAGGTWSQLFNYDWLQNRYPGPWACCFGICSSSLLGLLTYPIIRYALPGLGRQGLSGGASARAGAARLLLVAERLGRRARHAAHDPGRLRCSWPPSGWAWAGSSERNWRKNGSRAGSTS